jgi:hypothetical protein
MRKFMKDISSECTLWIDTAWFRESSAKPEAEPIFEGNHLNKLSSKTDSTEPEVSLSHLVWAVSESRTMMKGKGINKKANEDRDAGFKQKNAHDSRHTIHANIADANPHHQIIQRNIHERAIHVAAEKYNFHASEMKLHFGSLFQESRGQGTEPFTSH